MRDDRSHQLENQKIRWKIKFPAEVLIFQLEIFFPADFLIFQLKFYSSTESVGTHLKTRFLIERRPSSPFSWPNITFATGKRVDFLEALELNQGAFASLCEPPRLRQKGRSQPALAKVSMAVEN